MGLSFFSKETFVLDCYKNLWSRDESEYRDKQAVRSMSGINEVIGIVLQDVDK